LKIIKSILCFGDREEVDEYFSIRLVYLSLMS